MKALSHTKENGAVKAKYVTTIEATREEITALQMALSQVEAFKHLARKASGAKQKDADWTMYSFQIRSRDGQVDVTIDQGMCG